MIKQKKKICVSCGREEYIFSKGRCRECTMRDYRDTALNMSKSVSKPLSRKSGTSIPKRKKNANTTDIWLQEHWGFKTQPEVFDYIWENSPHKCRFTDKDLEKYKGSELYRNCFLHLLPKGKYKLFRLNPDNIVLGHPMFHIIVDQGTEEQRLQHPDWNFKLWDKMVAEKRKEYEEFKKEYLL